jgi:hypothetical protein
MQPRGRNLLQYAHFLPKYFPTYGTTTIVSNSSICCRLASHSFWASELYSELSSELSIEDGRESRSSFSDASSSSTSCAEAGLDHCSDGKTYEEDVEVDIASWAAPEA